ncbi:hypothetical protein, conserved [Trypanosoma brucei gambiense DAL972]|uniref:Methyltransferase n=1 Tax=Trypanosoma brucei gambiense (strain MHOM/CI/86/DAL972) TaxID=679716 RepID=C9ZU02_TRYB9|nr:hypothetical protein, conserved [Trypanosoma brucei gambiense DAL972]CBH12888.1 hypothetical protein, conserved [Trypanosoma brucei gambiense DAL972]|eukprot:XP_011775167.1 hypothetical protein, conserved [Trypanosoma brucei gambiense DAL972]
MTEAAPCFVTESGVRFDHNVERAEFNQYWYSIHTIDALIGEVRHHATACAFLSTPSLYFAMIAADKNGGDGNTEEASKGDSNAKSALVRDSRLFEYDKQWKDDAGFVFYDFHRPEEVPVQYFGAFDYVVADPPFITEDVWTAYIQTAKLLLRNGGKLLFTTVMENHTMLEGLLDGPLFIATFRPAIAHLTYQYVCFTNYRPTRLSQVNEELPPDDPKIVAAIQMANDLRESEKAFVAQAQQRDRRGEQPLPATLRTNTVESALKGDTATGREADIAGIPISAMKWGYIPDGLAVYANGDHFVPSAAAVEGGGCSQEEEVDYGETYSLVVALREVIDNFKRHVDMLQKSLDQMLKLQLKRAKMEAQGDNAAEAAGSAAAAVNEVDAALVSCKEQFDGMLEEMGGMIENIETMETRLADVGGEAAVTYVGAMKECVEAYANVPLQKQKLNELAADATRKYKSPLFNRMKELLQWIKDIKKNYQLQQRNGEGGE